MKAYYINLDRALERRKHMEEQAARLGIDLVRIAAVDGKLLSEQEAEKFCPTKGRTHKLSFVEIACFLSHRKAWQLIVDGQDTHGVVLEDDLLLTPEFPRFVNSSDWILDSFDVVKVETTCRPLLLMPPRNDVGGGRKVWRMASENMGGGGYILSRKAARILLDETQTFADPVDCVLFHPDSQIWTLLSICQMVPALCIQQVRSKTVFLDATAAASQMDGLRGVQKRTGLNKVLREIARPFQQAFSWTLMLAYVLLRGGRYGVVKLK